MITLGQSAYQASAIVMGMWRAQGHSAAQVAELLQTGFSNGINMFDNADVYGAGESELVFGEALRQAQIPRDQVIIQTKVGIRHDGTNERYDFSKRHLFKAVEGSLRRMRLDYLDVLLLHRPDPLMDPQVVAETFATLRKKGLVREFGVSNFNTSQITLLEHAFESPLVCDQLQLSLMHTGVIDSGIHVNMTDADSVDHDGGIYSYAQLHALTLQAWSPFQYGELAGTFLNSPKFPELNAALQTIADKTHTNKSAVAAAWILRLPVSSQIIVGTMDQLHLRQAIAGGQLNLAAQDWYDLYMTAGHKLP